MKKPLKKIVFIFLLALICLSCCACCKVSYTRVITEYGQVTKTYVIDVDNGYAFKEQAYQYLVEKVKDYEDYFNISYDEDEYKVTLTEGYDSLEEYYIAYGITGDEPNEELEIQKNGLLSTVIVENCSFDELMSTKVFPDATYKDLVKAYEDGFVAIIGEENKTGGEYKNVFEYTYGTPYKNVQSNADSVYLSSDGIYMHTWTLDEDKFADTTVYIRQISPNGTVWYLICIGAAFCVLALAIYLAVRRLKKPSVAEGLRFDSPDDFMAYLANKQKEQKGEQNKTEQTEPTDEKKPDAFDDNGSDDKKDV